jgi:hypothetical protein
MTHSWKKDKLDFKPDTTQDEESIIILAFIYHSLVTYCVQEVNKDICRVSEKKS